MIAKLENGERASVTLGDLFVLSRALNVPPFALLAPLTETAFIEVLPGRFMTAWDAIGWFNGDSNNVSDVVTQADAGFQGWYAVTDAYQMRWRYEVELLRFQEAYLEAVETSGVERTVLTERVQLQLDRLRAVRERLIAMGVEVPTILDPTGELKAPE